MCKLRANFRKTVIYLKYKDFADLGGTDREAGFAVRAEAAGSFAPSLATRTRFAGRPSRNWPRHCISLDGPAMAMAGAKQLAGLLDDENI
jgi:hypothetical protein